MCFMERFFKALNNCFIFNSAVLVKASGKAKLVELVEKIMEGERFPFRFTYGKHIFSEMK